ncbi:type IV secretion system protein VirB10 [Roseobacter weihaiensis]|uniref:type IV secretion system protein VirB10 n=1 Tax=Roseobacter weihaiensis TaxID=2763262 RepID=UPI001D0B973B|nr:type IV secretion system protein VirB10 [Roseobacter sp. H9]
MSDQNTNADPVVDGERTIASVTSENSGKKGLDTQKLFVLVGLAVGMVLLVFTLWPGSEPEEPVPDNVRDTRIRPTTEFQPAEILEPEPAPAPAQVEETPAPQEPVGPIQRIREQEPAANQEPTEAEQLLEASRRAPVVAFGGGGNPQAPPVPGATGTGAGFIDQTEGVVEDLGNSLAGNLTRTPLEGSRASVIPAPHLTITQGTSIPCNLNTAMDSTLGGMVTCTVTDDIYGTTGRVVLLERGTRVVGEYRGGVQRGQNRLFVIWTRAETPESAIISLDSPGTDALGRTGFDGQIDTQFWTRFSSTILLSIIDDALAIAAQSSDDDDLENTRGAAGDLANTALESTIDIPVILRKPQGEEVSIMVARDLDFSDVYRLVRTR